MTRLSRYDLWLADYTGGPNYDCGMQQFTSSGKVDGITGGVDMDTAFYDYPTRIREKGCNHLSGDKPATSKPSTTKTGTCTGDGVRIRAEAHTAAKVLGSADKGDRLELLDDDGWGWSKVKANGVTGWMYNDYINGTGCSKPKTVHCGGSYVNLRQGPSTSAKIVRQTWTAAISTTTRAISLSGEVPPMPVEIIVAAMSLCGTALGSLAGILTSSRLTTYRIAKLEEKVNKHNNLIERMVRVEQSTKSAHHRIDEIREEMDNHEN